MRQTYFRREEKVAHVHNQHGKLNLGLTGGQRAAQLPKDAATLARVRTSHEGVELF